MKLFSILSAMALAMSLANTSHALEGKVEVKGGKAPVAEGARDKDGKEIKKDDKDATSELRKTQLARIRNLTAEIKDNPMLQKVVSDFEGTLDNKEKLAELLKRSNADVTKSKLLNELLLGLQKDHPKAANVAVRHLAEILDRAQRIDSEPPRLEGLIAAFREIIESNSKTASQALVGILRGAPMEVGSAREMIRKSTLHLIRENHPEMSEAEVIELADQLEKGNDGKGCTGA